MNKEFYTVADAAEYLGLNQDTIRRYIREGKLQAVRTGNRYRIPHAALLAVKDTPTVCPPDLDQILQEAETLVMHIRTYIDKKQG